MRKDRGNLIDYWFKYFSTNIIDSTTVTTFKFFSLFQ